MHFDLHVRGTGEDVVYCPGDVLRYSQMLITLSSFIFSDLRLEAGHAVVDGGHLVWAVRVHGGLELSLHQSWNGNSVNAM